MGEREPEDTTCDPPSGTYRGGGHRGCDFCFPEALAFDIQREVSEVLFLGRPVQGFRTHRTGTSGVGLVGDEYVTRREKCPGTLYEEVGGPDLRKERGWDETVASGQ